MKRKVAVIAGGDSGEYDISIKSGRMVYQNLDRAKYEPYFVVIQGLDWHVESDEGIEYPIDRNDFTFTISGEKVGFDVVFVAIHGTPGENGRMQGYLDLLQLPYTSCNQLVSAVTFDKHVCKQLVSGYGIKVAPSIIIRKNEEINEKDILDTLQLPVFVKPNNSGSSVGISKVKTAGEFPIALEAAFKLDDEVIVEAFMPGREITCGVMKDKGKIITFPVTEIISKNEFFDFEAKYDPEKSEEVVPANIPPQIFRECQEQSKLLYKKLNCRGIVRFDYIFKDDLIRFLEVNSVPGMTGASIVPKMAQAYGWTIGELFDRLVENALE